MADVLRAIDTAYAGCKFRSRLEARWAVFFDALQLKWSYEPEGFQLFDDTFYLPDFFVEGIGFVEIKPLKALDDGKICTLSVALAQAGRESSCYLITGGIPDPSSLNMHGPDHDTIFSYWQGAEDWRYWFCICPRCGSVGIQFGAQAERNACRCHGEHPRLCTGDHMRIRVACIAARSERFEH